MDWLEIAMAAVIVGALVVFFATRANAHNRKDRGSNGSASNPNWIAGNPHDGGDTGGGDGGGGD